jgi:hypothetical protein
MAHLPSMARIMDNLIRDIFPIYNTIDDSMDDTELLPFRYTNKRDFVR